MDKEKLELVIKQNEAHLEALKFDQWITEKVNKLLKEELELCQIETISKESEKSGN